MAEMLLVTGVPGHGKSLLGITKGLEFVKAGRTVYAAGFKELDYEATGFKPLPHDFRDYDPTEKDDQGRQLVKWQHLEGAVILLDECYDMIPQRASGKPVPPHVEALARHRHYNIDLIFITQKHDQIDVFVKGLVGTHIHVRRKWGLNAASLRTWDSFQANTKSAALSAPVWKYPKANYKLYKSATAHSVKRKLPWYIYALPLIALAIGGCVYYVVHNFGKQAPAVTASASALDGATGAATGQGFDTGKAADQALRRNDYGKWMKPRIAGQPWTAPAWDQLQPQGVPDVYCIAVDDGRCSCYTEQMTHYELEKGLCRTIAREGVYNPFRKPMDERRAQPSPDERRPAPARDRAATLPAVPQITAAPSKPNTIRQSYTPPEYLPPNA